MCFKVEWCARCSIQLWGTWLWWGLGIACIPFSTLGMRFHNSIVSYKITDAILPNLTISDNPFMSLFLSPFMSNALILHPCSIAQCGKSYCIGRFREKNGFQKRRGDEPSPLWAERPPPLLPTAFLEHLLVCEPFFSTCFTKRQTQVSAVFTSLLSKKHEDWLPTYPLFFLNLTPPLFFPNIYTLWFDHE